ncbi:MAG: Ig-like domain-containing protein [Bacteroidales bacterium]
MKRLLLPFLSLIMLMFATQLSYSQCNITIAEPDPLNVIISGTTTICSGNTTVITVKLEGGTQPWHISYPGLGLSSEEIYDTDGTDDSTFVHTFTTPVLTNSITFNSSNVVVTDVNSCTANYTGAAIVTVNPQAEIFAGADATICETGTYSLSDATSSNTSSLLWTTSGTGTFSDNTITNPIYTPSAADISVGTVTLTLTGKGLESCDNVSDVMTLTITPQATIFAGVDATICETGTYSLSDATSSNTSSLLWTTSGSGTFSDSTIINPIYTPSAADITAGVVTLTLTGKAQSPCDNVSDVMTLTITPQATIFAGADATICETDTYSLSDATSSNTSSLLWTTSGTGTFSDNTITNPIYTPSAADIAAGTVTLTLTGRGITPCSDVVDKMTLKIGVQPIAVNDINSTLQGVAVSGNVSTNDIPSPGDGNVWNILTQPSEGTVVLNADGSYTYTPNVDFIGSDLFAYLLCDTNSTCDCDTAWVSIAVIPATPVDTNQRPIALNDTYVTYIGTTLSGNVLHNDYDPDGDALTVSTIPVVAPLHGTLTLNTDGTFTYIPTPGFVGEDSFTYRVCDDGTPSLCTEAVVSIMVIDNVGVNTTYAMDDMFVTDYNTPLSGNVLDNDYDLEGDAQTVTTTPLSGVSNGTLVLNSDGTFTYTPAAGYFGPDQFVYQVCDNGSPVACDSATVYLVVKVNEAPIVDDVEVSTPEDTPIEICLDITDVNSGSTFTASVCGDPVNGVISAPVVNNTTSQVCFTYTPNANFNGIDSLCIEVCDNGLPILCDQATVTIIVTPVNDPPVVFNEYENICSNTVLVSTVFNGDYDVDSTDLFVGNIIRDGTYGNIIITDATIGTYSYTVNTTITATVVDTVVVEICDNGIPLPSLCTNDTIFITIFPEAIVNAGADATICETGTYSLSDATASYVDAVVWTTSGDGTFSDTTILNPIYTPGANDIIAGTVTLTLTGMAQTGFNKAYFPAPCADVRDDMILTIVPQAIVNAGADATICETGTYSLSDATSSNTTSLLWTTSGSGTFSDSTITNPIYTPSAADITAGVVTLTLTGVPQSPCDTVSDVMTLTITPQAVVYAGADATICETDTYPLSNATATNTSSLLWTTSGSGTFSGTTIINPIYTPSAADITAGVVTLTLTGTSLKLP